MKVPRKFHQLPRDERRDMLEDSAYLAVSEYLNHDESAFDPVFQLVSRLEHLEKLDDYYESH